ncbi:calcium-binding protein [Okeania sp. KiyG1]|uniref:calcium-binding protein n=1 Tax=Okeania sp. KiyG1 TaxID=2720165 RepID=UPI001924A1E5|nr:calcium-binding protein [Okeania sp. KiyG1]GFZ95614.1 hypothetical protein CYANOKiyG1_06640 [Okeania sp. KiyG1]
MAVINGTSGNDFLTGTPFNDQIYGFDGFDTLEGSGGGDLISGGRQADRLRGEDASDVMYGGKENDSLFGGDGNDTLYGDNGNDYLSGSAGIDLLYGGSGADTFVSNRRIESGGTDSFVDFNSSEGDRIRRIRGGFPRNNFTFSEEPNTPLFEEPNTPFFLEFKQQGNDLLIGDSISEGYTTLVGNGEYINDLTPLLSSFEFVEPSSIDSYSDDLGNYEESFQAQEDGSETETDSEITDPLTRLREAEANLIQQIEHLEAGGSLSELGVQGPALETVTTTDLQGALSEIQGYISDELARQEEAVVADNFLLPEVLEPEKQVFVIEEGTSIPLNIQEEMMGGEILFVPNGYFDTPAPEGFFEEPNTPFFLEFKQQGNDLLIGDSTSEGYTTLVGNGEYINDLTPLLSSFEFVEPSSIDSYSDDLGNYEESFQAQEDGSETETDSEITDPLTRLREAEANLIQQIEHLEAGGSLSELGVQGPALETVTTTDLQGALSEIQGYISDELAKQEEAALADNFLLPEVIEPGKQLFVIEEGTSIPLNIQEEMMGGEILFVPNGYFDTPAPEGFF